MSRRDVPKVSSQDTGKSERGNTGDWRMVQWVVERGIGRRRQRSVNYFPPPLSLIPCLSLPCLFFFSHSSVPDSHPPSFFCAALLT